LIGAYLRFPQPDDIIITGFGKKYNKQNNQRFESKIVEGIS
jgi:hypothetical protein